MQNKKNLTLSEKRELLISHLADKTKTSELKAGDKCVFEGKEYTYLYRQWAIAHLHNPRLNSILETKSYDIEPVPRPIMIGDILDKLNMFKLDEMGSDYNHFIDNKWRPCGLKKSLQGILDSEIVQADNLQRVREVYKTWEVFKNPNIQNLWQFLWDMFKGETEKSEIPINELFGNPEQLNKYKFY